jgi:hypothetical protein
MRGIVPRTSCAIRGGADNLASVRQQFASTRPTLHDSRVESLMGQSSSAHSIPPYQTLTPRCVHSFLPCPPASLTSMDRCIYAITHLDGRRCLRRAESGYPGTSHPASHPSPQACIPAILILLLVDAVGVASRAGLSITALQVRPRNRPRAVLERESLSTALRHSSYGLRPHVHPLRALSTGTEGLWAEMKDLDASCLYIPDAVLECHGPCALAR